MVSIYIRRYLPLLIVWGVFLLLTVTWFTGSLATETSTIRNYGIIVINIAVILATASYLMRTYASMREYSTTKNWKNLGLTIYALVIFVIFLAVYLATGFYEQYQWLTDAILNPSYSTSWALTPFYNLAALYRSWKIRNLDTAVLVVSGFLSALAFAPAFIAMFPQIAQIGTWLNNVIAVAGYRVFTITSGLAVIAILLRALQGRSRGFE